MVGAYSRHPNPLTLSLSPVGRGLGEGVRMLRVERARRLRRNQTEAERRLWNCLRGRRFEGLKFKRQVPVEGYVADFLCVEAKLIVELDGGQHAEQTGYDDKRTVALKRTGFHVVRFWNNEVMENIEGVLEELQSVLDR